jgi:hypothetical protein
VLTILKYLFNTYIDDDTSFLDSNSSKLIRVNPTNTLKQRRIFALAGTSTPCAYI